MNLKLTKKKKLRKHFFCIKLQKGRFVCQEIQYDKFEKNLYKISFWAFVDFDIALI